jgi:hypothetical protein
MKHIEKRIEIPLSQSEVLHNLELCPRGPGNNLKMHIAALQADIFHLKSQLEAAQKDTEILNEALLTTFSRLRL